MGYCYKLEAIRNNDNGRAKHLPYFFEEARNHERSNQGLPRRNHEANN